MAKENLTQVELNICPGDLVRLKASVLEERGVPEECRHDSAIVKVVHRNGNVVLESELDELNHWTIADLIVVEQRSGNLAVL